MFRGLHLRLTALYLLAALALVALVGASAYGLLRYYFQTTTDLALKHKMASEFRLLGAPLPPELSAAEQEWQASHTSVVSSSPTPARVISESEGESSGDDSEHSIATPSGGETEDAFDSELAAIFVAPLDSNGNLLSSANPAGLGLVPDAEAAAAALTSGSDLRTVSLSNYSRMRLLTYRVTTNTGPVLLQAGRALSDQDRILNQLLMGLLALGGLSVILLGAGSWWLAGRSLQPAQRAWEKQQEFVANASHELRTPLTLMRASAEVALRGLPAAEASRRELLGDVLQECDHMNRLVEDLLLLSRLDAQQLKLERVAIALPELMTDLHRQVGRLAEDRGVKLEFGVASGVVSGDPTRLRQVLLILLDNALRHTPAGGIVQVEVPPGGQHAQIIIADTGSGVAPEHLPHVFDRFYRASDSARSSDGGAGLGLSIAKALVEAQHGQIRIESRGGQGTRVTLTLSTVGSRRTPSAPSARD